MQLPEIYSQVRAIDKVHMLTFVSSNIILFRSSDEQSDPWENAVFSRIRMYSVRGIIRQYYSYIEFSHLLLYLKNLFYLGLERAGYCRLNPSIATLVVNTICSVTSALKKVHSMTASTPTQLEYIE